jgi:RHS repeat-associated protein
MKLASSSFIAITLLAAGLATAQVSTGTPPFGSFAGGSFDTVNLGNLNTHFAVSLLHKAGRGTPFTYDLNYDSSIWQPVTSGSTTQWQPAQNWGWRGSTEVTTGYMSSFVFNSTCWSFNGSMRYPSGTSTTVSQFVYHDSYGVSHPFAGRTVVQTGTCGSTRQGFTSVATDGSGYTLTASAGGCTGTITSRGGTVANPPCGSTSGAGTITDANGNQITVNNSGQFFDTLSSATPVLTVSSAAPPTPTTFTYAAPADGASNCNPVTQCVSYSMNYQQYTVRTNFGVSNTSGAISEYGPLSNALVSYIALPDDTPSHPDRYVFTYEKTSGSCTPLSGTYSANCVTGRIASVTLPTGGIITYTYSGGPNNTGVYSDGSSATLSRQLSPGGTWTYARTAGSTSTLWTTTVTDPDGNQAVLLFAEDTATANPTQNFYETERLVYQGTSTLVQTIINCYNGNGVTTPSSCGTTEVASPITRKTTFNYLPDATGKQSETDVLYNNYGLITSVSEYDYGNAAIGSLVRQTATSYAALGNGIVDRPSAETIYDGSGHLESSVTYSYDESTYPLQSTSGIPNHVSITGARGNATSIYSSTGSTTLGMHYEFYDTGSIYQSQDVNGSWTKYVYGSGSCSWAFPTQINQPLGISTSSVWNCAGAVSTSSTDANGKTTTVPYSDSYFWRPASIQDQALNTTNLNYTSPTAVESYLQFNNNASIVEQLTTLDGFGRVSLSQQEQAPGSTNYDSSQITYDSSGRLHQTTMSYVGTSGQASPGGTPIANTTSYDTFGRITENKDGGGGYITYGYTKNDVLYTLGPAPTGENAKERQLEYDALGRLTSVCEITSAATGGGTCAQTSPQTGYWTQYTYDATTVNSAQYTRVRVSQNSQGTQTQTRTYLFDLVGRLVSETNPENGITTYLYDTASGCPSTCPGNLLQRTDNKGNTTSYVYDALHRVTSITYSGPDAANTPNKYFVYDTAIVNNVTMSNTVGRLAEAYTGSQSSKLTDIGLSYSVRGEVTDVYQSTPHSNGYYHVEETFWPNGALATLSSNVAGVPTQSYGVDSKGRVSSVSAASGQNPVTSTVYDVLNQKTTVTFGSLDSDVFTFDPNTGRLIKYQNNVGTKSVTGSLTWNANGTLQKLGIADTLNSLNTQTCTVGYDDLVRVASANCGASTWSQTFAYDPFGNIQKSVPAGSTGIAFLPNYSLITNQFTSLSGVTPTYDGNGNLTADGTHNYAWDAEGKMLSVDTTSVLVTYDALGHMVEQNRGGAFAQIVYSPSGGKFALMNGQTLTKALVPLPAGAMAVYKASGLSYYRHSDWLGSSRLATTPGQTLYGSAAYAPFGEPYAQSGTQDLSFTGQDQDTVTGIHDFAFRRYNPVHGRWLSPDPAGFASANFANPQTLNRYAYVRNNPLALVDPLGLCDDDNTDDCTDVGGDGGGSGGGTDGGGQGSGDNSGDQPPTVIIPMGPLPDLGPYTPVTPDLVVSVTVDVTEPTPDPIELERTTVNLTGLPGQVGEALLKLQKLLPLDPKCLQFLASNKANPLYRLNQILRNNLYGVGTVQPTAIQNGYRVNNGDVGLIPGQAITVNTLGAFFNSSYNNIPLTTDRGRINGGTPQAQVFIVLHELAHTTNTISADGDKPQSVVDANDKTIEKNCSQTIKAAGK